MQILKPAPGQGFLLVHPYLTSGLFLSANQDYELEAEKLRSLLDLENGRNSHMSKRARLQSPAAKVKEEVSCVYWAVQSGCEEWAAWFFYAWPSAMHT